MDSDSQKENNTQNEILNEEPILVKESILPPQEEIKIPNGEVLTSPEDPKYNELLKEVRTLKAKESLREHGVKKELLDDLVALYVQEGGDIETFIQKRKWSQVPDTASYSPNPPAGKSMSMEDIGKMSADEINTNWETIVAKLGKSSKSATRIKIKK